MSKPTITQADRNAAAVLASQFQKYTYVQIEAPAIKRGEHDDWELVKAFARHREAERELIVDWLRGQAFCGCGRHDCIADNYPNSYADAIERGDHERRP